MLCSDGLLEAENEAGEQFGQQRLLAAIADTAPAIAVGSLQSSLLEHLGSGPHRTTFPCFCLTALRLTSP